MKSGVRRSSDLRAASAVVVPTMAIAQPRGSQSDKRQDVPGCGRLDLFISASAAAELSPDNPRGAGLKEQVNNRSCAHQASLLPVGERLAHLIA
jgi:hypothetical protein